jgi:hypothetical protein
VWTPSANPTGVTLATPWAALKEAIVVVRLQSRGGRPEQPRIEGEPFLAGRLVDPELECVGETKVEARHPAVFTLRRWGSTRLRTGVQGYRARRGAGSASGSLVVEHFGGWRRGYDEVGVASVEADLDGARCQFACDLVSGRRQHLQEDQPGGRLERSREALGHGPGVVTTGVGSDSQLMPEAVYVDGKVHGTIMAPLWHIASATVARSHNIAIQKGG